ncbi:MAG: GTP 3',8-cyclase MoaA [Spirochaetales bacterium]
MVDLLGRPLRDLRISVTDSCNFRCTYCLPAHAFPADYPFLSGSQLLTFDEILRVVEAALPLGLKKVKLTGGEPLLRSLLPELVRSLSKFPGLETGLITNGLHLEALLPRLVDAGLGSVTVSLDALDPEVFSRMTGNGHSVEAILKAIDAVHRAYGTVKINTVLLRGENDDQVESLARHFRRPGFDLRFVEFMDVGTLNRWSRERVVPGDEVLARLQLLGTLTPLPKKHAGETSERWAWSDVPSAPSDETSAPSAGQGSVGFINSVTRPFCGDCSRVRLGADGRLYTCLFSAKGFDLRAPLRRGESADALGARLAAIWSGRSDRYSELRGVTPAAADRIEMFAVGG